MNFEPYKIFFTNEAINAGYSKENIDLCLKYAKPIIENGLPVIYNTTHLSGLVGYSKEYIKKAVYNTPYYYRSFKIKKRNGSLREISEPLPSLKEIQLWILNEILYKVKVSVFAKAYRPDIGLIENIKYHTNQPKVFSLDIENFYPSISREAIQKLFESWGYSEILSNLLSKLCTLNESLPQGAPTSPYLSNLFFSPLDIEISEYCKRRKIMYTRYADDMTFSGDFDHQELNDWIKEKLSEKELSLNENKTQLMLPNNRQVVTGIVVNEKTQVPIEKRKRLRQTMFYIKKFGFIDHMKHEKINKGNYLEHLIGKVNFVLQMNPSDSEFLEYKKILNSIKTESKNQS